MRMGATLGQAEQIGLPNTEAEHLFDSSEEVGCLGTESGWVAAPSVPDWSVEVESRNAEK